MKCRYCPIPATSKCQGEDVRRFCELIDPGHAAYEPGYVNTLRTMVGRDQPGAKAAASKPKVAESLARLRSIQTCPFRSTDSGCGCSGARCAPRRGELVSYSDCFECVRRYG